MPDYKNGKIYKIECQETNRIYIGSTCQPTVAGRLRGHVQGLRGYKKGNYSYMSSFSILETGNYKCLLVCNYPCDTKDELTTKEAEYIRQYKNDDMYECVNTCIPHRTKQEYKKDNVEKVKEYNKKYKKQYRENNADKLNEYAKKYREANIDKMRQIEARRDKETFICGCGGKYTKRNKSTHKKTKKHMKWEATQ